ncbi:phosphoadenosine phosphosulfate reductase family protein [Rhodococcus hoagii]|nr:phosphoadenosine phosphosulfate reductase family protein [Prescottella equi]NKS71622.1 phosphoadenosine phosphosulfate reductase family protein [Prescottella equi]
METSTAPGPALDVAELRKLRARHSRRPQDDAWRIEQIAAHLDRHDGYVAFSGGKDSTIALHLARQADPNVPVVYYDSGLDYPENHSYINELADRWDLNLSIVKAEPSALAILIGSGAWDHSSPSRPDIGAMLHEAVILEPAQRAHAAHGAGNIWGLRAAESPGRAQLFRTELGRHRRAHCNDSCPCRGDRTATRRVHGGTVARADGTVSYSPIWNMSDQQVWDYLGQHQITPNPVYSKLERLGAPPHARRVSMMVDSTALQIGRMTWLKHGWPHEFAELCRWLPRLREWT